jgi:hypothetical protein
MITYKWTFTELFANEDELVKVGYLLTGTQGETVVESQGTHEFSPGISNKKLADIVESDLVQWIEKDTTQDDVNLIKLAIENQINAVESSKKVDFPWLAGTFTI